VTLAGSFPVVELTDGSLLTYDEPIVTFDAEEDTPGPVIPQARRRTRSRRRRAIPQTKTSSGFKALGLDAWPG
jgi:hypothetical protein